MGPEIESELAVRRLLAPSESWGWRLLLPLVFTGGLASLGIEFAAARLLAPFFGQSLFIWGTLIGLILIYLTIGYYVGGRLADRRPEMNLLFQLTAAGALLTATIPVISRPILSLAQTGFAQLSVGLVLGSLISVIVLFAAPVILLGMVSPFVIRLRIRQLETAGNAAGAVYALSTLGSILGTFLPVFWLIPTYGTRPTIFILAFLLGMISTAGLVGRGRRRLYLLIPIVIVALAAFAGGGIRGAAYGAQVYEIDVPLDGIDWQSATLANEIEARFHDRHEELYTYASRDQEVVFVNARVAAVGRVAPSKQARRSVASSAPCSPRTKRKAYFGAWRDAPVYALETLESGHMIDGPAIVEAETTTVVINSGDKLTVNDLGWLDIQVRL